MILELLFLIAAAVLLYRSLMQMTPRGSHKPVGTRKANPQLVTMLDYAQRLFDEHKYLSAEKAFLSVLKLDHKNVTAYTHLGKIYVALKNYPEAIECFQSAAQLSPDAHIYFVIGSTYYENKNYVKAIGAFEKSLMFEHAAGRYVGLSRAYYRLANIKKAITAMQKAVEIDPDEKNLELLGELYLLNHDVPAAREMFESVLKLNPQNPQAKKSMSRLGKERQAVKI